MVDCKLVALSNDKRCVNYILEQEEDDEKEEEDDYLNCRTQIVCEYSLQFLVKKVYKKPAII